MGLVSTRTRILERIEDLSNSSTSLEDLAYASNAVNSLSAIDEAALIEKEIYEIGTQGHIGFGIGAAKDEYLLDGMEKLEGHNDTASPNYGRVLDKTGSVMRWIPRFYFKFNGNLISTSSEPKSGYVLERCFTDGGTTKHGMFVDDFMCGNVNGIFTSRQGIDPCSTSSDHNPISALNNSPANNYGGLYKAVKTRGSEYALFSNFAWQALEHIALAQGQSATSVGACAYIDVAPAMPKGNLNNALSDINDNSVTFEKSGYSNCALTGSGKPYAKTTHNGQNCGIADLNGNMWEVTSGFIKLNDTDSVFKILKPSVSIASINNDGTGADGAYNADLYEDLDLSGIVDGNNGWTYFGNGDNAVFEMSTDVNSDAYKKSSLGIPKADGVSGSGTTQFGNDGLYRYRRNEMSCLRGGHWGYSSNAGVLAVALNNYRTSSSSTVGGRAFVLV